MYVWIYRVKNKPYVTWKEEQFNISLCFINMHWLTCTEWCHCIPAAVKRYFHWSKKPSWVNQQKKNRAVASLHHWEVCVVREKLLMWACSIQDESACARTSSQHEDSDSKDERNERHVLRQKKNIAYELIHSQRWKHFKNEQPKENDMRPNRSKPSGV